MNNMQSYVFISHASEDKKDKVKPLVEALAIEGVKLWLDRPGHGENHFGFDQNFIDKYEIISLQTGQEWDLQIRSALKHSGAILSCLSGSLKPQRQVLVQEFLIGRQYNKLVACIVDDMKYEETPRDLGLIDPSKIQAERINPEALSEAIIWIKEKGKRSPDDLPCSLKREWEVVRKLIHDLDKITNPSNEPKNASSPTESFSVKEIDELVSVAIEAKLYEQRDEILALFEKESIGEINIGKSDTEKLCNDLRFLNGCEALGGTLHPLTQWLDYVADKLGDTLDKKHLSVIKDFRLNSRKNTRTAQNDPLDLGLSEELRLELRDVLVAAVNEGSLKPFDIKVAYLYSTRRPVDGSLGSDVTICEWIADKLGDTPTPEDPKDHPAILFISFFESKQVFSNWLDRAANKLVISETDLVGLKEYRGCSKLEYRLIIVVSPMDANGFRINGWMLINHPDAPGYDKAVQKKLNDQEILAGDADEAIKQLETILLEEENMCSGSTIELFLPMKLLCTPVENLMSRRRRVAPFACLYAVVVRSWERNFDESFFKNSSYPNNWKRGLLQSATAAPPVPLSSSFFEQSDAQIVSQLAEMAGKAIVLTFQPKTTGINATGSEVHDLLQAGVSVAIWPHCDEALGDEFDSPAKWKEQILEHRQTDDQHHFTLLWDDPQQMLPRHFSSAPRQSEQ